MAGPDLHHRPLSPQARPRELGNAALQWARGRRGRVFVLSALLIVVVLGLGGARNETIKGSYHALSANYEFAVWRTHLPHLPSYITSPLKPSNTSLELENNHIDHVPSHLNKATPNFHLLMPALDDGPEFCKTTLSAMILNYPPPTIVGLKQRYKNEVNKERDKLWSILAYLKDEKVKEDDLALVVDGKDTWFQLPSDVMVRQYQEVLEDSNKRLLRMYGQQFKHTIMFGATKVCEDDDVACRHVSDPMLPANIYGKQTGKKTNTSRARYLDANMSIGPVKDLRALYQKAVKVFEGKKSQRATMQSVMATIFAEQQMARKAQSNQYKITQAAEKFFDWVDASNLPLTGEKEGNSKFAPQEGQEYEFSIGLDYTHTLFQPLANCAEQELVQLLHNESVDLSKYHHQDTPTALLTIPTALREAAPPYWTPDLSQYNPSPNEQSVHIESLQFIEDIDELRDRDTPWASTLLVQNTYTGAVPATFHVNDRDTSLILGLTNDADGDHHLPSSNISWASLWYSGYERAMLRNYFRNLQSPVGYHNMAVGGDRLWDQRGGRGGVWTAKGGLWYPWGEVDGVCGSLVQLQKVFPDGKGVWLHEMEGLQKSEEDRVNEEEKLVRAIMEKVQKEAEEAEKARKKKEELERQKIEQQERKKKGKESKEKQEAMAKVNAEKNKQDAEQKAKDDEERVRKEKEEQGRKDKERQQIKEKAERERKEKEERERKEKEEQERKQEQQKELLGDKLTKWQGKMGDEMNDGERI